MRSAEQADWEVMFAAREDMRCEQVVTLAEQEKSRVWVMRTRDFSTWKKELEFCDWLVGQWRGEWEDALGGGERRAGMT